MHQEVSLSLGKRPKIRQLEIVTMVQKIPQYLENGQET